MEYKEYNCIDKCENPECLHMPNLPDEAYNDYFHKIIKEVYWNDLKIFKNYDNNKPMFTYEEVKQMLLIVTKFFKKDINDY